MKLAITSTGKEPSDPVDQHFGRAAYFIIADTEGDTLSAVSNEQNLNAAQGAGIQSAQTVSAQDVEAVLTGHCGPKAFRTLKAAGIRVYIGVNGTVSDALERFKSGSLREATEPNVEGHWV